MSHCNYCDTLTPAIDTANYCSHRKVDIQNVVTNAYYFANNKLHSGHHLSRFSIRAVYNGYQLYEVENREHEIGQDKFLVVNEGEGFEHSVDQESEAEGIIVAFNPHFLEHYLYAINHSPEELLDKPFERTYASLYFYNNSYEMSQLLDGYLKTLISDIKSGTKDPLYFQQLFHNILDELVGIEQSLHERISKLKALKKSTRDELYRRLSTGKDFIDAHLHESLSIERIAQVCCLSPFHFLRSFSRLYQITPYQYILMERLKKARFLIDNSGSDIGQIIESTGFENKRTFQRAFQKVYGITPYARLRMGKS